MPIVGWRWNVFVLYVPSLEWDNEPHTAQETAVSRADILLCLICCHVRKWIERKWQHQGRKKAREMVVYWQGIKRLFLQQIHLSPIESLED